MTFSLRRIQKRGINGSNCFVFYLLGLQWGSWDYRYFFISSYVFTVFMWILSIYISFVGGFLIFFFFHLMLASVWNGFSTCFIWGVIFNDIHDFDEISHSGRIVFQEGSSVGWNAGFKGLLGILEFRKGGLSKVPFCMCFFFQFCCLSFFWAPWVDVGSIITLGFMLPKQYFSRVQPTTQQKYYFLFLFFLANCTLNS